MTDFFTKSERSRIMSSIKSCNTAFELGFMKLLSRRLYPAGFRYRKHPKNIIGKPDIVFIKHKIAVFLDSDFWHGNKYPCEYDFKRAYWHEKIARNVKRDKFVNKSLRNDGWKVLRLREKDIRKNPTKLTEKVMKEVSQKHD
jgi:DNA mismatch endonuclease (patch repair protein)